MILAGTGLVMKLQVVTQISCIVEIRIWVVIVIGAGTVLLFCSHIAQWRKKIPHLIMESSYMCSHMASLHLIIFLPSTITLFGGDCRTLGKRILIRVNDTWYSIKRFPVNFLSVVSVVIFLLGRYGVCTKLVCTKLAPQRKQYEILKSLHHFGWWNINTQSPWESIKVFCKMRLGKCYKNVLLENIELIFISVINKKCSMWWHTCVVL